MLKRALVFLLLAVVAVQVDAQDLTHYKKVVKELSSRKYQGRGYIRGGANKAGRYLEKEYRKAGADAVTCQPFTLDINTFGGKMDVSVDGRKLQAGKDFTVREFCPGVHGTFNLYHIDTLNYDSDKIFADLAKPEYQGAMVVCDFWFTYKHKKDFQRLQSADGCTNAGLILTWDEPLKFYKAYGETVKDKPVIWLLSTQVPKGSRTVKIDIDNKFLDDYECFNVIAKVDGARHDSCYVFTAHYDHLGNLGRKVFYAGANDNASGTAAIVTLAAYYAKHRPPYDMYFVSFSGEDANLRGSEYFAEHPIVPLTQIKYLFNVDMIGDNNPVQYCETSDQGQRGYELFEKINAEKGYFQSLNHGKLAANSDHYPFATRGVPCIFLENAEGDAFPYYHTTEDNWQHAYFDSYEPVFKLIRDFVERY
jgi:hypothetical protein